MLLLLINIVIIVVVGAIVFYLIDKYVRDGRLGNLLKILVGLICLAAILQRLASDHGGGILGPRRERGPIRPSSTALNHDLMRSSGRFTRSRCEADRLIQSLGRAFAQ